MTGGKYKWGMVGLLTVVGALNYCDRAAIASIFPLLRSDLRMSNLELAGVGSFFLWAYALASPFGGILADRQSRSRIVVWTLVGASLTTFAMGFVSRTPQLLFLRVLLGFFEAPYLPAAMALIADFHGPESRASAIGLHAVGLSLGLVAGGAAAGYVGKHMGWHFGFRLLGAAGLAAAVASAVWLRDAPPNERVRAAPEVASPLLASLARLARNRSFVAIVLASIVAAVGNNIFINWFPLYFSETFHMGLARAGFAGTFALNCAGIIGLLFGSAFSDRISSAKPERRMLIRVVCGILATPFLFVFFSSHPRLFFLNFCIFFYALAHRFGDSYEGPMICDLLSPKLRSTAFGLQNSANCAAGGIGVAVAGLLKSRMGLGGVFAGTSGLALLASGIVLVGYLFFARGDLARRHPERRGVGSI